MPWEFGLLGLFAAVATAASVADAGPVMVILLPAVSTVVMTLGAVHLMKLANRDAQRRIAMGEYPEMTALRPAGAGRGEEGVSQELAVQQS